MAVRELFFYTMGFFPLWRKAPEIMLGNNHKILWTFPFNPGVSAFYAEKNALIETAKMFVDSSSMYCRSRYQILNVSLCYEKRGHGHASCFFPLFLMDKGKPYRLP